METFSTVVGLTGLLEDLQVRPLYACVCLLVKTEDQSIFLIASISFLLCYTDSGIAQIICARNKSILLPREQCSVNQWYFNELQYFEEMRITEGVMTILLPCPCALQTLCAMIKVLVPLDPLLKLAGCSHHHYRDPCSYPMTLEPGSKRQATS